MSGGKNRSSVPPHPTPHSSANNQVVSFRQSLIHGDISILQTTNCQQSVTNSSLIHLCLLLWPCHCVHPTRSRQLPSSAETWLTSLAFSLCTPHPFRAAFFFCRDMAYFSGLVTVYTPPVPGSFLLLQRHGLLRIPHAKAVCFFFKYILTI